MRIDTALIIEDIQIFLKALRTLIKRTWKNIKEDLS